ncbi:MAG: DinB family protein, partial [Anaerolineaceae bacterium]|nr:DinB family protein [Anaerolineaceae bacterium]
SPLPLPEIPVTVAGLAAALKQAYQHEQAELESVLKGVTEEEASYKPGENDWSIKDVLAHLIQGERGSQNIITELFLGHESIADGFGDNVDAYIKATVQVYGTARALEEAFHTSREETVRLVANLPESFAKRKSSLWKLGYQLLAFPYHAHEHAEQIKTAISKARKK